MPLYFEARFYLVQDHGAPRGLQGVLALEIPQ